MYNDFKELQVVNNYFLGENCRIEAPFFSAGGTSVVFQGKVVFCGGYNAWISAKDPRCFFYEPLNRTWTQVVILNYFKAFTSGGYR